MKNIFIVILLVVAVSCYRHQKGFELLQTNISKFQKSNASANYSTDARNLIYQVEDDLWKELDDARKKYIKLKIFLISSNSLIIFAIFIFSYNLIFEILNIAAFRI